MTGSTVLVEKSSDQPYLVDWYNHCAGDIKDPSDPIHGRFERGLEEIKRCEKDMLARFTAERKVKSTI